MNYRFWLDPHLVYRLCVDLKPSGINPESILQILWEHLRVQTELGNDVIVNEYGVMDNPLFAYAVTYFSSELTAMLENESILLCGWNGGDFDANSQSRNKWLNQCLATAFCNGKKHGFFSSLQGKNITVERPSNPSESFMKLIPEIYDEELRPTVEKLYGIWMKYGRPRGNWGYEAWAFETNPLFSKEEMEKYGLTFEMARDRSLVRVCLENDPQRYAVYLNAMSTADMRQHCCERDFVGELIAIMKP